MILSVDLKGNSYDIHIKRGILKDLPGTVDLDRKVLIVTDSGVPEIYSRTVASRSGEPVIVTVPEGEDSKSIREFEHILKVMLSHSFSRKDCVVAVGGGVPGDLAGFCAASYMRGIDFYNMPTTLLSQVDSSVGGKTAVNLDGIKNIVGAFYQPKAVIIDPGTLDTLPERQLANGYAEALKMSVTSDSSLFEIFENEDPLLHIETVIEKALKVKISVVEQDEKERGLRRILNFGHTIGHGIESCAGGELYHGECVAVGMLAMSSKEVRSRLLPVYEKLGLPVSCRYAAQDIFSACMHDKKSSGARVSAVFSDRIGSCYIKDIDFESLIPLIDSVTEGRTS